MTASPTELFSPPPEEGNDDEVLIKLGGAMRDPRETIEMCYHCNKRYIAVDIKGMHICQNCKITGHSAMLPDRCEKCFAEIKAKDQDISS
jgi:hypothetical protein